MIITQIIGNYNDLKDKYPNYSVDMVKLEQWESSKSRIKKKSHEGRDIAIVLERNNHLHNNDILMVDEENKVLVLVSLILKNVLQITLPSNITNQTLFKLGHALGNQHWPAVLHEGKVYVPLYVSENIMRSMLKTHSFQDIDIEFIDANKVANILTSSDFRLLFSGDDTTAHHTHHHH